LGFSTLVLGTVFDSKVKGLQIWSQNRAPGAIFTGSVPIKIGPAISITISSKCLCVCGEGPTLFCNLCRNSRVSINLGSKNGALSPENGGRRTKKMKLMKIFFKSQSEHPWSNSTRNLSRNDPVSAKLHLFKDASAKSLVLAAKTWFPYLTQLSLVT
jgi:hypothetical protein